MKIVTDYWAKPIPVRNCDWSAVDADTYDGEGPVGYGATEAEAIADLEEQLEPDPDRRRETITTPYPPDRVCPNCGYVVGRHDTLLHCHPECPRNELASYRIAPDDGDE